MSPRGTVFADFMTDSEGGFFGLMGDYGSPQGGEAAAA